MTVKELIKKLKCFDENHDVVMSIETPAGDIDAPLKSADFEHGEVVLWSNGD